MTDITVNQGKLGDIIQELRDRIRNLKDVDINQLHSGCEYGMRVGSIDALEGAINWLERKLPEHDAAIAAQEKALDLKKEALKEQKEVPLGVTEKCYIDMHGKKGFDEYGIFEPVKVTVDYAVISVEAKKIQDQIEASKAAKKKQAVLK